MKPLAGLAAFALAVGTLIVGQFQVDAMPKAHAASYQGVANTGGWKQVVTPTGLSPLELGATVVNTSPTVPFLPIDKETLYFSSYVNGGTVGHFATGGLEPTTAANQAAIGYGKNITSIMGNPLTTMAIDADPYGTRGEKYAYFWAWDSSNTVSAYQNDGPVPAGTLPIVRWAEGSTKGEFLLVPNVTYPGFPNQGGYRYWSAGETIQKTGEIFFGGGECNTLDYSYNMMIFDPVTYAYNFSGKILPADPGDDIFNNAAVADCGGNGYVASDMALDANGNAYVQVMSTQAAPAFGLPAAPRKWLVRIVPGQGGESWTYNLVTPLQAAPGQSSVATNYATSASFNYGSAFYQGMLYVSSYQDGGNLLQINPMSGYVYTLPHGASTVPTMGPVANYVQDMASGQTARVIEGHVYNDANANGVIDPGEIGQPRVSVALYMKDPNGSDYIYEGKRTTDPSGSYSFLVGGNGDYIVRILPVVDGVNAMQTWARGGGVLNPVVAQCVGGNVSTTAGGICDGALAMPAPDPALPTDPMAPGNDTSTQPGAMAFHTTVTITSDEEVARADFGITTQGSYGDASIAPTTVAAGAPMHLNAVHPIIWLGSTAGSYSGPATNDSHASDDGVYVDSYAGKLSIDNTILAGTRAYQLAGDVSGPATSTGYVSGWTTGAGTDSWNSTPAWSPSISANGKATGVFQFQSGGTLGAAGQAIQFRASVSTVPVTRPDNAGNEYQATVSTGTPNWVTPGEIEDYRLRVADAVYRPAASTTGGTGDFTVDGATMTAGLDPVVGAARGASANAALTLKASVPSGWTVQDVLIKETEGVHAGRVISQPAYTVSGTEVSFSYAPALGSDAIVEVVYARDPDPGKSTLGVSPASTTVGMPITATATIVDPDGQPLSKVAVSFAKKSSSVSLSATTCTTDSAGVCSVEVTSQVAAVYGQEVSASVDVAGVGTAISGSPATVVFTAGGVDDLTSSLSVDPTRQMAGSHVTVVITARDAKSNPVTGIPADHIDVRGTRGDASATVSGCVELGAAQPGVYTCSMTAKLVGTYTVSASLGGVELAQKPTVEFYSGGVCVSGCTPVDPSHVTRFEITLNDQIADGKAADTAMAYAYDTYGNPVEDATVEVVDHSQGDLAGILAPQTQTTTTGSTGTSTLAWTSTTRGTFTVRGLIDGLAPQTSVMHLSFVAGSADPTTSTLQVTPHGPIAAGGTYTLTATVRDATGNTMPGEFVTFSTASSAVEMSDTRCETLADGRCSVTLTSKVAGSYPVHARIPDKAGAPADISGSPAMVTFVAGDVCVSGCVPVIDDGQHVTRVVVDPNGLPADGVSRDLITVHAFDRYGNPVTGAQVHAVAAPGPTLRTQADPLTQDGVAILAYTSTIKGAFPVTITVDSLTPTGSPAQLLFGSGSPDWSQSWLTIDPVSPVVVGSSVTVTAHVVDANKNPVENAVATFAPVANLTFDSSTCVSSASGVCSVSATSTTAGTYTISATGGVGYSFSNTVQATFVADQICVPGECTPDPGAPVTRVETVVNGVLPDGMARDIFAVYVYDKYGNPISSVPVASTPADAASSSALIIQPDIHATAADGTSSIWYSSVTGGTFSAHVTVGGKTPQGSPVTPIFGGVADPGRSSWAIAPESPLTVGQGAANAYTLTATLRDANGVAVPNAAMTFAVDPSGPRFDMTTCVADSTGTCQVVLTSTKAGTFAVSASTAGKPVASVGGNPSESVAWKADAVCAQASGCDPVDPHLPGDLLTRVQVVEDNATADGTSRDVAAVHAFDKWGNPVQGAMVLSSADDQDLIVQQGIAATDDQGRCTVWYASSVAGSFIAAVTVDGDIPAAQNFDGTSTAPGVITVNFVPGHADPAMSRLTVDPATQKAYADVAVTAVIKDAKGNPVPGAQVRFEATNSATFGPAGDARLATVTVPADAQGVARATLTDTTKETVAVTATIRVAGADAEISGSPTQVRFTAGDPDPDPQCPGDTGTHLSVAPLTLPVGEIAQATALITDEHCIPVEDVRVDFAVDPGTSAQVSVVQAVTGADGKAYATLTDTIAETVSLHARVAAQDIARSPQEVVFQAGVFSWTASTFTVTPSPVMTDKTTWAKADGKAAYTGILTARDEGGNLLTDLDESRIDMRSTSTDVRVSAVAKNRDGTYTATFTSLVADATPTATAAYQSAQVGTAHAIPFAAGDPVVGPIQCEDPTKQGTHVSADPTQVGVGQHSTVTTLVTDAHCNPVEGATVGLRATGSALLAKDTGVTDADGLFRTTVTDLVAETVDVHASIAAGEIGNSPVRVTFTPGGVDAHKSSVSVAPSRQTVGAPVTVTVTVRDGQGNALSGIPASQIHVAGDAGDRAAQVGPCLEVGASQPGAYTCQMTAKLADVYTVTARVTGILLDQKPNVEFTAGGTCVTHCDPIDPAHVTRFEMRDNDALADGVERDTAHAFAYDMYGNPVAGATVVVEDRTLGAAAGFLRPATQTVTTGQDGTAQLWWTSTRAAIFSAEGWIDGLRPVTGATALSQIRFSSGLADPWASSFTLTPASPIVVGNSYTASVAVRDAAGNPVAGETVGFHLDPSSPAWLSKDSCTTSVEGTCAVRVTSTSATTVAVHATLHVHGTGVDIGGHGDRAHASPQTAVFVADTVCVTDCTPDTPDHVTAVEVVQDGAEANGQASNVAQVRAYDKYGNPVANAPVTSTPSGSALQTQAPIPSTGIDGTALIEYRSVVAGAHTAAVTVAGKVPAVAISMDGLTSTTGTIWLNFASGTADAQHSWLTISPTGSQSVGSTFLVTAHLADRFDNPVEGAVITFPAVDDLSFSATSCHSLDTGVCQVSVTSTRPGTYVVSGRIGMQPVSNAVQARFTPGEVCFTDCHGAQTRVEVTRDGQQADGIQRDQATAYAYDRFGNPVAGVTVASTGVAGRSDLTVQPDIQPTGADGTTTIWYSTTRKGSHLADVTIGGGIPHGSPITVNFGNGTGDAEQSSWVIAPAGPLTVGEGEDSTYTATATVKDSHGNLVPDALVSVTIDHHGPVVSPSFCWTDDKGMCSVDVWSTWSGTYTVSASISSGVITVADTGKAAASVAWTADAVCSQAAGCDPVDPNLPGEKRTRAEVTRDNQAADGVSENLVTVWAFDQWGNPVEGAVVQSTSPDADLVLPTGVAGIGHDGSTQLWYTSTVAGRYTADVRVDGLVVPNSPVTMKFVPGAVCVVEAGCTPEGPGTDPSRQTRAEVSVNDQPVGGTDQITVFAFDRHGNSVDSVEFVVTTLDTDLALGGMVHVPEARLSTGVDGSATLSATSRVGGSHLARVLVGGVELSQHGSPLDIRFLGAPTITGPKDGDLTNEDPLVVTGTGQTPGDTIVVRDGDTVVCETTVAEDLTWSCSVTLPDGDHTLTATEEDEGRNVSEPSAPIQIVVDTTAPSPPIVDPSNGSRITGEADPDSLVTVTDPDGNPIPGCVDVKPDSQGRFECRPETPLDPGSDVLVTASDEAGNTSDPVRVTIQPLSIEIAYPMRMEGDTQVVTGYNFNPGELVLLWLPETGESFGPLPADGNGTVTFSFLVGADLNAGPHTAMLDGDRSGSVYATFTVAQIVIPTGGRLADSSTPLWGLAVGALAVSIGLWVGVRRRTV
ncbi:MAG: Ig-like domain-containing protein [Propionibacteriaceae bacterium]|nr:Ig-like domain-containing protein [Propionibacteriaceae bacterium]